MKQLVEIYHQPVLLEETIDALALNPDGIYVDLTLGGGGHSRRILDKLSSNGRLIGFDQDADAEKNMPKDDRFIFVRSNFRYISNFLQYHNIEKVDGILADLGVSSHHFDTPERGFSCRFDGPLDMRMNQRAGISAEEIVNDGAEQELARIFYQYGELKQSRMLAKLIVQARKSSPIESTFQLMDILRPAVSREGEKKIWPQIFQALRIEVNKELDSLEKMLQQTLSLLSPQGRLAIITFHSLEDRIVKNFMKTGNFEGRVEKDFFGKRLSPIQPIGKIITPSSQELEKNPRSRSAKLRIASLDHSQI